MEQLITQLNQDQTLLDLNQLKNIATDLGILPHKIPVILIGGTNGKGSTVGYLAQILISSGYKVGIFTSPHLFKYNERISVNHHMISDDDLYATIKQVLTQTKISLGLFKTFTLASYLYFKQQAVNIAIYEVGIGGRLDCTNIFNPIVSLITSIGLDHQKILGATIEQIAWEKAHIYRSNRPALCAVSSPPQSLINYSQTINTKLKLMNKNFGFKLNQYSFDYWDEEIKLYALTYPKMRGEWQIANATMAIHALLQIKQDFPVAISQIKTGILQNKLLGRFDLLAGNPVIVIDVAHNQQAIKQMLNNMQQLAYTKRRIALFAICDDKDLAEIIKLLTSSFDQWYITQINSPRTQSSKTIRQMLLKHQVTNIVECTTVKQALTLIIPNLKIDEQLICFGSFVLAQEAYYAIAELRSSYQGLKSNGN